MKYKKSISVAKAVPPALPLIIAEIIGMWEPQWKEGIFAIGTLVTSAWVGIANWWKNRHKV